MRQLLNLVSRLQKVCADDAIELRRLRQNRQTDITAAEQRARVRTEGAVSASYRLGNATSLRGQLRAELGPLVSVQHLNPGPSPVSFDDAVVEWARLAPSAERRARQFRSQYEAWQQRLIKRQSPHRLPKCLPKRGAKPRISG